MSPLARIYLVRHGETDENRNGVIQGQMDTSLNSVGFEQARLVGEALRSIPLDMAYSSDLRRATLTAEAILAHHPNAKHEKQEELRERYMGEMQGKTVQTKLQAGPLDRTIESGPFFAARVESWWNKYILDGIASLAEKTDPYHLLVTTHGGFIGTLIRILMHNKRASCAKGVVIGRCFNTSVTIIDVEHERKGLTVVQFGDISHLNLAGLVENNVDE